MRDQDMEDNYLWDRSGEADPEVQQLEEILGTLRYQPRPLEIPSGVSICRRRASYPLLAIAAGLALLAIGLGLWFNFSRRQAVAPFQAKGGAQIEQKAGAPSPSVSVENQALAIKNPVALPGPAVNQPRHREAARNLVTRDRTRAIPTSRQPELTPQELADKEQVLIALRLVSVKLNLAQRKAQGAPSLNSIRNQHRIG